MANDFDPSTAKPVGEGAFDPTTAKPASTKGNIARGAEVALRQIPQTLGGTVGLIGDAVGAKGVKDYGMKVYKGQSDAIEQLANPSDSFSNVLEGKDGANAGDFLGYGAGYVGGQALTALATGGVGGLVGKKIAQRGLEAGISKEAAALAARQGATTGAATALGASNLSQEAGSIYPDALEQAQKEGRTLDGGDLARVGGAAALAAGVETATDAKMLKGVFEGASGAATYARRALSAVPRAIAREAGTEAVQTEIERVGSGQSLTDHEAVRDVVDSAALGGLGGAMGGAASAIHKQAPDHVVIDPKAGPTSKAAAMLALPPAAQKVNNWEVVDGAPVLPAPPRPAATITPEQQAMMDREPSSEDFAARDELGQIPGLNAALPAPQGPQPIMVDSQGNAAPQPSILRTDAQNRALDQQQADDKAAGIPTPQELQAENDRRMSLGLGVMLADGSIVGVDGRPFRTRMAAQRAAIAEGTGFHVEQRPDGFRVARGDTAQDVTAKGEEAWQPFSEASGSLGIPRADMPQIKSVHRGAMVNFLNARGIEHDSEQLIPPNELHPTQAEFSPSRVEKATKHEGDDRSILVSSDNRIIDGHHQWLAKLAKGEPVKAIRLHAPVDKVLSTVKEFPSATVDTASQAPAAAPAAAGPKIDPAAAPAGAQAGGDTSGNRVPDASQSSNEQDPALSQAQADLKAGLADLGAVFDPSTATPHVPVTTDTAERYGAGGKDVAKGGKPFKTKLKAIQFQNGNPEFKQTRIAKHGDGFVLRQKTDAELETEQKAGEQRRKAARSAAYEKNPFLAWLGEHGLFHQKDHPRSLKTEYSPDKNPMTHAGPLFRATGKHLDVLASQAAEAGFLPPGSDDADALEKLVHRAIRGERVAPLFAEGEAEKELESRMADHQAAADDYDPFADGAEVPALEEVPELDEADWADTAYATADAVYQREVEQWVAKAQAAGVDAAAIVDKLKTDLHEAEPGDFHAAALDAIQAAIAAHTAGDGRADHGQRSQAPAGQGSGQEVADTPPARPVASSDERGTEDKPGAGNAETSPRHRTSVEIDGVTHTLSDTPDFASSWPRPHMDAKGKGGRTSMFNGLRGADLIEQVVAVHNETGFAIQSDEADARKLLEGLKTGIDPATDKPAKPQRLETMRTELLGKLEAVDGALTDYATEFPGHAEGFEKAVAPEFDALDREANDFLMAKRQAEVDAAAEVAKPNAIAAGKAKKAAKDAPAPRAMTHEGRAVDGKPIMPGDVFAISSGRTTTPYPTQQSAKYATQWLIDNAVAEAKARGDSFNAGPFAQEKPGRDGQLPPASRDAMLEYLFGEQPAVVPGITKPLTGAADVTDVEPKPNAIAAGKAKKQAVDVRAEFAGKTYIELSDAHIAVINKKPFDEKRSALLRAEQRRRIDADEVPLDQVPENVRPLAAVGRPLAEKYGLKPSESRPFAVWTKPIAGGDVELHVSSDGSGNKKTYGLVIGLRPNDEKVKTHMQTSLRDLTPEQADAALARIDAGENLWEPWAETAPADARPSPSASVPLDQPPRPQPFDGVRAYLALQDAMMGGLSNIGDLDLRTRLAERKLADAKGLTPAGKKLLESLNERDGKTGGGISTADGQKALDAALGEHRPLAEWVRWALAPGRFGQGRLTAARIGEILGSGTPGTTIGTETAKAVLDKLIAVKAVRKVGDSYALTTTPEIAESADSPISTPAAPAPAIDARLLATLNNPRDVGLFAHAMDTATAVGGELIGVASTLPPTGKGYNKRPALPALKGALRQLEDGQWNVWVSPHAGPWTVLADHKVGPFSKNRYASRNDAMAATITHVREILNAKPQFKVQPTDNAERDVVLAWADKETAKLNKAGLFGAAPEAPAKAAPPTWNQRADAQRAQLNADGLELAKRHGLTFRETMGAFGKTPESKQMAWESKLPNGDRIELSVFQNRDLKQSFMVKRIGEKYESEQVPTKDEADAQLAEWTGVLAAPTQADVLAQQDRTANVDKLDEKAAVDREVDGFTLQQQTAPEQRKDTSGDLFGGPSAADVTAAKQKPREELRAQADLKGALADLADLFGAEKPKGDTPEGDGETLFSLTPEQEQKLMPILARVFDAAFRLGKIKFQQAAKYVLDQVREALGPNVADAITLDHLQGAYISMAGKYREQGADTAKAVVAVETKSEIETFKETPDVSGPGASVERPGSKPADQPQVGADLPGKPGRDGQRAGQDGDRAGDAGRGREDDSRLPASGPALVGDDGDQQFPGGKQPARPSLLPAGDLFGERGDHSGDAGVQADAIPASAVTAAADVRGERNKRDAQRAAAGVKHVHGDLENIREALPYLLPGQQEDVYKAETRFAKPDGYGIVFTNGTGTGKTFSGLGIAKRFHSAGKKNILVVVPDQKILEDWVESGHPLDLTLSPLEDTKTAGKGPVITTYANLGLNDALASRDWDLVIADEAHSLMQDSKGTVTTYLEHLRAITHHPQGVTTRYLMQNRDDVARQRTLSQHIEDANKRRSNSDTTDMERGALREKIARWQAELTPLTEKLNAIQKQVQEEVKAKQGAPRARLVGLSATPFAYEPTIDWANGYLFDYHADYPYVDGRGYNTPSPMQHFFVKHLGYRMKYNKLTKPDAKVDSGLMQRQFNSWLKKEGVLSGRMLDVAADYDRRFVLVDSAIGNTIDNALEFLSDQAHEEREANRAREKADPTAVGRAVTPWTHLRDSIDEQFDYLSRRYLLEAIKAKEAVPIVKQHLALGRKVVVFHDYKKGGSSNPFDIQPATVPIVTPGAFDEQTQADSKRKVEAFNAVLPTFRAKFPQLFNELVNLKSPIDVFKQEFGDQLLLINGDEPRSALLQRYKMIQDDTTKPLVALVQSAKNKGWSGHDTTGKFQRVLLNLGQPTAPTLSIQQEGRIYRTGQVSNAIFRYMNTGTNWEKWAFATTIAERASAAENLSMGELARALKDAYIAGFEESADYPPGHEGEGTGGKERDAAANNALTEYDRAKAFYYGTQKKTSKTKAQEGKDYFATPEPVGLKMVQWASLYPGEKGLEPSGGHGAIARWFPELANRVAIEPSSALRSRLAMVFDGKIIDGTFEDHAIVNKYDAIVMNPPFGVGGKTAIEHLEKAAGHLNDGGRIVALLPSDGMAAKRLEEFLYGPKKADPLGETSRTKPQGGYYVGDEVSIDGSHGRFVITGLSDRGVKVEPVGMRNPQNLTYRSHYFYDLKPGPRTTTGTGLELIADVKLPSVTFERAGTGVMTHIIVLQKGGTAPQMKQRDLTGIDDVNALFDELENFDIAPRPAPAEDGQPQASAAVAPANTPAAAMPQRVGQDAPTTLPGTTPKREIVEVTTRAGKVLRGVITKLTKVQAQAIDPYTWEPHGRGTGFFIREKHLKGDSTFSLGDGEQDGDLLAGDDAAAQFRMGSGERAFGADQIRSAVDKLTASWDRKPDIKVIDTFADAPAAVQAEYGRLKTGGAKGAPEAFHHKGTIYLVADRIPSGSAIIRTVFHEALGHYGLRNAFGDALLEHLNRVANLRGADMKKKAKQYGLNLERERDRMIAAEEVLAELAQTRPEIGLVRQAIAAIRTWLRANVPGFASMKLSDDELVRDYILPARNWVERGADRAPSFKMVDAEPAFSTKSTNPFYSALAKEVDGINAKAQPSMGWQSQLQGLVKAGKVKADELEWSGLTDWLKTQEGKVTKEAVAEYLEQNGVRVSEVQYGQGQGEGTDARQVVDNLIVELDAMGWSVEREGLSDADDYRKPRLVMEQRSTGEEYEYDAQSGVLYSEDDGAESIEDGRALELARILYETADEARGREEPGDDGGTRYHDYTLPGGENYREVLLTLPGAEPLNWEGIGAIMQRLDIPGDEGPQEGERSVAERVLREAGDRLTSKEREYLSQSINKAGYHSSHWDEKNILAHIRLDDRVTTEPFTEQQQADIRKRADMQARADALAKKIGQSARDARIAGDIRREELLAKLRPLVRAGEMTPAEMTRQLDDAAFSTATESVMAMQRERDALLAAMPPEPKQATQRVLFVEELQSDWAQAGRKQGFKGSKDFSALPPGYTIKAETGKKRPDGNDQHWIVRDERGALFTAGDTEAEARADLRKMLESRDRTVPNAPFVGKTDAWLSLALKRVIKLAVDEGYDRVAFVNGEQSADRYDLSRQVSRISYEKHVAEDKWEVFAYDLNGKVDLHEDEIDAARIEALVGKDLARKIVNDEGKPDARNASSYRNWKELSGLDLKVGGEGMKAFYDKIVPAAANKLLAKLGGGKMEAVTIAREMDPEVDVSPGTRIAEQPGFTITDAMRNAAGDGLPMFSMANKPREIQVGGKWRPIENAKGQPIASGFPAQKAFWQWFGDSKVVDAEGKPVVVYHGTNQDVSEFDRLWTVKELGRKVGIDSMGSWFSTNPSDDGGAAMYGSTIMPTYLAITKPWTTTFADLWDAAVDKQPRAERSKMKPGPREVDQVRDELKAQGYDGIKIVHDPESASTEFAKQDAYIAFEATQIKSATGNRGTFDPNEPSILKSTRRDFLIGTAAALAGGTASAETTMGRAKAIPAATLSKRLPADVEKILVGNGHGTTNIQGAKAIADALKMIAATGPQELRALAGEIASLIPAEGIALQVDKGEWSAHGAVEMSPIVRMRLFDGAKTHGMTFGTFLHESLHAAAAARYRSLSIGTVRSNDAKLGMPAPAAAKALEQFRAVWDEFGEVAKNAARLLPDGELKLSLQEAIGNPDEFFVRSLTDPQMQAWLATQAYEGKTLFDRFKSWVKTSLFGMRSEGNTASWLDAALAASDDMLKAMQGDKPDFSRLRAIERFSSKAKERSRNEFSKNADALGDSMFSLGPLTPDQEAALKNVGGIKAPVSAKARLASFRANLGLRMKQGLVDQFAPIKDLSPMAYVKARLSKGAEGTMEAALFYGKPFLRDGVPDVTVGDGGFAAVMAGLKGEHDRFLWWVAAQRAQRLKAEGRENLFTDDDISSLLTLADGNTADGTARAGMYATALAGLNDYNDAVLKMAVESGLIDEDARQLFRDQPYVPFYRVMEDEDAMTGPRFSSGLTNQYAYKKLKGGKAQLNDDLMQNMLMNWAHLYTAAARNRAALETIEAADALMIASKLQPHAGKQPKNAVKIMRDGKAEHWAIEDPYLFEAITALHYTPSPLMAPLAKMKKVLTFGVTVNPLFKVRNLMRDSLAAMAMGDLSYNPIKNVAQGWKAAAPGSQTYASMLASGGVMKFGSLENAGGQLRHKIGKLGGTMLDEGQWASLQGLMGQAWDAYQELGDRGENANRAALYQQLVAKGMNHADASFAARDLMDFSMSGKWAVVRFLVNTVPFLNARLQGLYKLGTAAAADPKRFATIAGAVSLASLALLAAYHDDDDWKKREDWDRDSYWWFKIGDRAFRFPKPFEVGAIGTVAERTAELFFSKEMTGSRFMDRLGFMASQTFALNPVPQAFSPLFDVYANRDPFLGRPIESQHDKSLQPKDRYDERTSEIARFLGQLGLPEPLSLLKGDYNALAPKQWDYLLRGYFSWIGASTAQLTDYAIRPLADRGERPTHEGRAGLTENLPSGGSRYVSAFYEQADAIEKSFASYRAALKAGDTDRAAQLVGEGKLQNHMQAGRIKKQLEVLNARGRQIEESKLMDGETKRAKLDEIAAARHKITKGYMEAALTRP